MMHLDKQNKPHEPHEVDVWFPPQYRKPYVEYLMGLLLENRPVFTPSQAEYFVRLWGYGYLRQEERTKIPIEFLSPKIRPFRCSQREAADLFYGKDEKEGRAAGSMLKALCRTPFVSRQSYQGAKNRSLITLDALDKLVLPNHRESKENHQKNKIYAAQFDPKNDRNDVVPFIDSLYSSDPHFPKSVEKNIRGGLKDWSKRYPEGMRVIRYVDEESGKPEETIGLVAAFPVHEESDDIFYQSPRSSFYLGTFTKGMEDPIKYAAKGDDCESVCIRCWQLNPKRWTRTNALLLFNETQNILRDMQREYPGLETVYSIPIHETLEKFARSIGFQLKETRNPQDLYWLHIALERFLAIDGEQVLTNFDFRDVDFR